MNLPDYTKIEQVGNLFWRNDGDPSKVLGHHAGQVVLDEAEPLLGYGTHGDFIVMEAAQVMRGYAFSPR